jgi:hypothetical protein
VQYLSPEQKIDLTRSLIEMMDDWGLQDREQVALLGLPDDTRTRQIRKYRNDTPLPEDEFVMERVEHLMGIADALRTSYPTNAMGGSMWLNRRNTRFQDRTPLQAMLEDGMRGIVAVRIHLDCAYDWQANGA